MAFMCSNLLNIKGEDNRLHRQFSHPDSKKIKHLVKDCGIDDPELIADLEELDKTCDICNKYKKPKPRPRVGLP